MYMISDYSKTICVKLHLTFSPKRTAELKMEKGFEIVKKWAETESRPSSYPSSNELTKR